MKTRGFASLTLVRFAFLDIRFSSKVGCCQFWNLRKLELTEAEMADFCKGSQPSVTPPTL